MVLGIETGAPSGADGGQKAETMNKTRVAVELRSTIKSLGKNTAVKLLCKTQMKQSHLGQCESRTKRHA